MLSAFPSVTPPKSSGGSYMVMYNQMVGGMSEGTEYGAWGPEVLAKGVKSGTMAGPMVFWERAKTANYSLVLTPVTHAMEMNMLWDTPTRTLQAGLLGSVSSVPANYSSETMLFLGPVRPTAPSSRPAPSCNTKGYSSTYLAMGFANVRAGTWYPPEH